MNGRVEQHHLTAWSDRNIELFLCKQGFGAVYQAAVPQATIQQRQSAGQWPAPTDPTFWEAVIGALKEKSKIPCAHGVVSRIDASDPATLPADLTNVVTRAAALAGS